MKSSDTSDVIVLHVKIFSDEPKSRFCFTCRGLFAEVYESVGN